MAHSSQSLASPWRDRKERDEEDLETVSSTGGRPLGAQGTAAGNLSGGIRNAPVLMRGTDIESVSLAIDQVENDITAVKIKIRNGMDFLNIVLFRD